MDFEFSTDGFLPYDSFEHIYQDRKMPEFGNVASPYECVLSSWKFYLANGEGELPFGFESPSFDDSDWAIINVPSTWQTEGYGLPQNLLYDYPLALEQIVKRGEETISDKYLMKSTDENQDEIGIYRTSIIFTPEDIDRAIYLETSGICGSFDLYINGHLLSESFSVTTRKRILISDSAKPGTNQITIAVYRWDREKRGHIAKELMNMGFSGIFRPLSIVKESLIDISNLRINVSSVPDAFINQLELPSKSSWGNDSLSSNSRIAKANYSVTADFKVRNHTDVMMPYNVSISLMEARSEYDPYKLPLVQISLQSQAGGVIDAHSTRRDKVDFVAIDVASWTDATPVQYDLIIEIMDSENRVICVKKKRFGFRTTEIINDKFHINDKPIALRLVKYYEFDPKGGISVPLSTFRQDIILMKRCGINGVIGMGFPLSDEFLNLCDQYGIYVIASTDRRFMRDYAESCLNHPSIIMWAFNDYRYDENKCIKVKNEVKTEVDGSRPWYVGVDFEKKITELTPFPSESGIVFGPWEDLCLDRLEMFAKNKTGKSLFENIPGRTRFPDDNSEYKWIHHADLVGGKYKADSSIGQGIVDADRNPHPIYHDIKTQCQTVVMFAMPDDPYTFTLRNAHPFAYCPELLLEWKILLGGNAIMSGKGTIPEIEPYGTRTLKFPINIDMYLQDGWANGNVDLIEMYMGLLSHQIIFEISLKLAKDTYYAKEGFEVALYQDIVSEECGLPVLTSNSDAIGITSGNNGDLVISNHSKEEEEVSTMESFDLIALPSNLDIEGHGINLKFSRTDGALCGINSRGNEYLCGSLMPSFYRCPSNIDRTDRSFILSKTIFSNECDYEEIQKSIKFVGMNYGKENGVFSIISRYKSFAFKDEILVMYEILSSDNIRVTLSFTPKYDMVRYGFRVKVNKEDTLCTWYGRGPGESYYDRKNSTRIGLFSAGCDKIYHSYARPSENSSHVDTIVMKLTNSSNTSLEVRRTTGDKKFEFTILPYTPEQMNESLHEELLMQNDFCELMLDFCTKEIERTDTNLTNLPLKKNVPYKETFEITIKD